MSIWIWPRALRLQSISASKRCGCVYVSTRVSVCLHSKIKCKLKSWFGFARSAYGLMVSGYQSCARLVHFRQNVKKLRIRPVARLFLYVCVRALVHLYKHVRHDSQNQLQYAIFPIHLLDYYCFWEISNLLQILSFDSANDSVCISPSGKTLLMAYSFLNTFVLYSTRFIIWI